MRKRLYRVSRRVETRLLGAVVGMLTPVVRAEVLAIRVRQPAAPTTDVANALALAYARVRSR